jgi:hypothetical protein
VRPGTLGDALITVTKYTTPEGQAVIPKSMRVPVEAAGCAFATRTVAMTPEQIISVRNVGTGTAIPSVAGAPSFAVMVAMPGGDPVKLVVPRAGRYGLIDKANEFSSANIFALAYATTDVTDVDGTFDVQGIPPGEVEVTAFLPITGAFETKKVTVAAGASVAVDFTLTFDKTKYETDVSSAPAGSAAAPAGSAVAAP